MQACAEVISCGICNWCPLFYRTVSMDQTWVGRWTVWAATIPSPACLWAQAARAAVWAACRRSWMRAALSWSWCIVTRAPLIPPPPLFTRRYVCPGALGWEQELLLGLPVSSSVGFLSLKASKEPLSMKRGCYWKSCQCLGRVTHLPACPALHVNLFLCAWDILVALGMPVLCSVLVLAAKLTLCQAQCVIKTCLHSDFPCGEWKCAELRTLPTRYVWSQVPLDAFLLLCCMLWSDAFRFLRAGYRAKVV